MDARSTGLLGDMISLARDGVEPTTPISTFDTGPQKTGTRLADQIDRVRAPGRWLMRNPVTLGGLIVVLFFALLALMPGVFTSADPVATQTSKALQGPSGEAVAGTDQLGRDIY